MSVFSLFSKRQKELRGEVPDVYQYNEISNKLRVQIIHIVEESFGNDNNSHVANLYKEIHQILCKEYGKFSLGNKYDSDREAIFNFFLNEKNYEYVLDIIEIFFRAIQFVVKESPHNFYSRKQEPDDAINELNIRFKEAGLGYQFEEGELIKVDSQFIHSEVVKPVLELLGKNKDYRGASAEFLAAHEHYRHQRYKECLNDCLKSFESLMKSIHKKHSWTFNQNDTAKKLINGCLTNGLIPQYLQNQFSSINILLESGVPTIRNKEGGHGQGHEVKKVPEYLASYALHLTATNLLFLIKCEENFIN
ncbi:abortive infection family protein [Acinetobacter baumannii 348935]|uniref:STM4504/CBY_0614 family protein n=1 Tax=Acinetobacter TaxID=469 RepID=UPI00044A9F94|nr:abortive infection family protein [Acinetobacter baumannii 348935]